MNRLLLAPIALVLVAIVGCAPPTVLPASAPPTRVPLAFDLNAVVEKFLEDCKTPSDVGDWFCDPVIVAAFNGEGSTLWVPTSIDPAAPNAKHDAEVICGRFANNHDTAYGADLGYKAIGIFDENGANLASCSAS